MTYILICCVFISAVTFPVLHFFFTDLPPLFSYHTIILGALTIETVFMLLQGKKVQLKLT